MKYERVLADLVEFIDAGRRTAARTVNTAMVATYWHIGRRIVEEEQAGAARAEYGTALLKRLARDLSARFGRGFGRMNLQSMRQFYLCYPSAEICQTPSGKSLNLAVSKRFLLPWSHYVSLLTVDDPIARGFYEEESLKAGWTVKQLQRQIATRFLGIRDDHGENELEAALLQHLQSFLLELGDDFAFVARQRRLRIDDVWFKVDLVFFHRRLRCLVLFDLKLEELGHADVGQMNLYVNYAREHWALPEENPPVGVILCTRRRAAVARYALGGLESKVAVAQYLTALPSEEVLVAEIERAQRLLEARKAAAP
jgi:predicted nuclease of restriction endonuclease-like (RecB) superfamily